MVVCGASDPNFLDGSARSHSFLDFLAGSSSGKFLDLIRCSSNDGGYGPSILVTWPFSKGDEPLSKSIGDPIFTLPITLVSRDVLQYHLSRESVVLHGERLLDNNSDDDGSFYGEDLDSQENYDLSIIQIGDEGFCKKSGKHNKRKTNEK
ncbi:hypothetical protein MA16_Dca016247 [Dendrobium catenatum]|uniref:Uncharacterized protein n=1 Tax=Dendrobium catenatum TaxID=906689 RepID=A0A2I0VVT6_9ASPA|nr:hypothetical protein MA16_Dca016247 [Dendrobium catenatum]